MSGTKVFDFSQIKTFGTLLFGNDHIIVCQDIFLSDTLPSDMHAHTFYEIQFVYSGSGVEIFNDRSYALKPGSVTVIAPGDCHAHYSTNSLCIRNICILPNKEQEVVLKGLEYLYLEEEMQRECELLYLLIENSIKTKTTNNCNDYLNLILKILYQSCRESHPESMIDASWNHLLLYINENYKTVTLEDAARLCNFSKGYFCRKFKREFSVTFMEYIDNVRVEKAKKLLKTSDEGVYDVMHTVGFSNSTRFFRIFKRLTGMTPYHFRKNADELQLQ